MAGDRVGRRDDCCPGVGGMVQGFCWNEGLHHPWWDPIDLEHVAAAKLQLQRVSPRAERDLPRDFPCGIVCTMHDYGPAIKGQRRLPLHRLHPPDGPPPGEDPRKGHDKGVGKRYRRSRIIT